MTNGHSHASRKDRGLVQANGCCDASNMHTSAQVCDTALKFVQGMSFQVVFSEETGASAVSMLGCARWPSRVRCRVCAALHCSTSPRRRVRHRDEATHAPRTRLCRHTGIAQTDRGRRSASGLLDKTDFSSTSGREGAPVGLYRGGGADEGERLVKRSTQAKRRLPEVSGARLKRNADGRNRNTAERDSQRGSRARPPGSTR